MPPPDAGSLNLPTIEQNDDRSREKVGSGGLDQAHAVATAAKRTADLRLDGPHVIRYRAHAAAAFAAIEDVHVDDVAPTSPDVHARDNARSRSRLRMFPPEDPQHNVGDLVVTHVLDCRKVGTKTEREMRTRRVTTGCEMVVRRL